MNYKKIYDSIISFRITTLPDLSIYYETHHIIPKSLGGSNNKDNLVKLTAREHFVCHFLLANMYEYKSESWYKMNKAFMMMKCNSTYHYRYFNSRLYSYMRQNFSICMSKLQQKEKNSQHGKMWIYNEELKQNKTIKNDEQIPIRWKKGRVFNFDNFKEKQKKLIEKEKLKIERLKIKNEAEIKKEFKKNNPFNYEQYAINNFQEFMNGNYKSIREFAKEKNRSAMYFSMNWKKYILDYNLLIYNNSPKNTSKNVKERYNNLKIVL